jgi:hypothetical protein
MEDLFVYHSAIPEYIRCSICQEVFNSPTRIECGHTYCLTCISTWTKKQPNCPNCRSAISTNSFSPDKIAQYIVNDLLVKCLRSNCKWVGKVEEFKTHQNKCTNPALLEFEKEIEILSKTGYSNDEILLKGLEEKKSAEYISKIIKFFEKKPEKRKIETNEKSAKKMKK